MTMGRYYRGDIEGKFWFAVQSSVAPKDFSPDGEHDDEDGTIRIGASVRTRYQT